MTSLIARTLGLIAAAAVLIPALPGAGAAAAAGAPAGNVCDLESRGFAGFAYRDIRQADRDSLGLGAIEGLILSQVLPGSPAEAVGLKAGDIVTQLDAEPLVDSSKLASLMRRLAAGDTVEVSILRGGVALAQQLVLATFPRETASGIDVEYTCFVSRGARLRAVITSPEGSAGRRLPAMLLVSALGSPRLVGAATYGMGREIAYAATRAGFRVLRFELSGYGDSEGEDYRESDFDAEVADNLAALDYLAARADVDPGQVFVMGHSTGGMEAAVLASRRDLAGLIVSCTVGRTFYERSLETLRMQSEFAGDAPAVTDTKLREYMDLMTAAARGDSLDEIIARSPALAQYVNSSGRIMDDRTLAFWRGQLNLNLAETYSQVTEPVLVIYAASDFITLLACHEHIRDVLVEAGNKDVTLEVVPEADHGYLFARDKREAYDAYGKTGRTPNPEPIRRIVRWLEDHKAP